MTKNKFNIKINIGRAPTILLEKTIISRFIEPYNADHGGFVDVKKIVKGLDIELKEGELLKNKEKIYGMIKKDREKYIITVNQSLNDREKRFIIGHELGHYIFHKNILQENGTYDNERVLYSRELDIALHQNKRIKNMEEYEADEFSLRLLMPRYLIRRWCHINVESKKSDAYLDHIVNRTYNDNDDKFIVNQDLFRDLANKLCVTEYHLKNRLKSYDLAYT